MTARWLLVVCGLFACGDDGNATPKDGMTDDSGSGSDGDIDAAMYDPVTVTVTNRGAPMEGMRVVFVGPTGTLAADTVTDAGGVASAMVEPGGSVTLVQDTRLDTYRDVQPGDALRFGSQVPPSTTESFSVLAPTRATATGYGVYICGKISQSSTPLINVSSMNCRAPEEVVTVAVSAAGILGAIHTTNVTPTATVDIPGPYVALGTRTMVITNAGTTVDVNASLYSPTGLIFGGSSENNIPTTNGNVTIDRPEPTIATALAVREVSDTPADGRVIVMDVAPQAATSSIDFAAGTLPGASDRGAYDETARRFSWTATTGAATPDATLLRLEITRGALTLQWAILDRYGAASVDLPMLPADVEAAPMAGDTVELASLTLAKVPGGFDSVRRTGLQLTGPDRFSARGLHVDDGVLAGQVLVRFVN